MEIISSLQDSLSRIMRQACYIDKLRERERDGQEEFVGEFVAG